MVEHAVLEAEDAALVLGEVAEGLRHDPGDRLATDASGGDEAGGAEPDEMPRDQRLAQPDALDELGDRRLPLREPLQDPKASASVLWTRRRERSSSGWSTTDAMVERMCAGDGAKTRSGLRLRPRGSGPFAATDQR